MGEQPRQGAPLARRQPLEDNGAGVTVLYRAVVLWNVVCLSRVMRLIADFIFLVLFVIFLVGWLLAWAAFHVAGGAVHLLLILAVVWLIAHFMRRRAV